MKIAFIQRFLPSQSRGGVGHFAHEFANTLCQRGHEVTVFSQDTAPSDARYEVKRVGNEKKGKLDPIWFPLQMAFQDFSGFDLIHAQGDDQFLVSQKIPVIRTMHGSSLIEAYYNGIRRFSPKHFLLHIYFYFWEFMASFHAKRIVAVSEDTRQFYPRVDSVIPNGINEVYFANSDVGKSENPSILFVGEVNSRKRGNLLIDIFSQQVLPKISNAELWLVSPEKITLPGVHVFSGLSTEELAEKFKQAWVLCLPSSYEGFGRPYAEALAAKLPVVASINPGAMEVLQNGQYGKLAEDSQIGQSLIELLQSKEKRAVLSVRGQERAKDFSWDRVVQSYEKVYEECLNHEK